MLNTIILVFAGGALGAVAREFLMLSLPDLADGFPLPIFAANIIASFLLGLVTALNHRQRLSDEVNMMLATGVMGGLSTFSSFVWGAYVVMTGDHKGFTVALLYLLASLATGYLCVWGGFSVGRGTPKSAAP